NRHTAFTAPGTTSNRHHVLAWQISLRQGSSRHGGSHTSAQAVIHAIHITTQVVDLILQVAGCLVQLTHVDRIGSISASSNIRDLVALHVDALLIDDWALLAYLDFVGLNLDGRNGVDGDVLG